MDAFPQTKPHQNRETNIQTPEVIPQKQELTMFWSEIGSLDPVDQELAIMQMTVPYEQGTFFIHWNGNSTPTHTYGYKFLGATRDEAGAWHYQLENEGITDRFKDRPELLAEFQEEFGVAYPTFPVDHKFSYTNGGPTEIWLQRPDMM